MIKNFIYIIFFSLSNLPISYNLNNSGFLLLENSINVNKIHSFLFEYQNCLSTNVCYEIDFIKHSIANKKIDEEYEHEMLILELL
ncbi:hypothetical protein QEJ31_07385 [Pigmentibacter sp. JX0631]|uniref:hypothetical protein n=1 Tax=Pigmentibacter sp. JX0631 TaxID=2976982 RepID=UPI00246993CE|nr:hypothetical protein [Pigmentibacter sp. JX0631]WGL61412.1 hypothetical protein QEJ31_07385 [Pigmentibacter sp. JX0631]